MTQPQEPSLAALSSATSCLQARNLAKTYGKRQVVKDVSLTVKAVKWSACLAPTARARPPRFTCLSAWCAAMAAMC